MTHIDFSKLFVDLQSVSRSDTEGLTLEHCSDTKSPGGNSVRSTYRVCDPKEPWRELARITVLIPQYEVK